MKSLEEQENIRDGERKPVDRRLRLFALGFSVLGLVVALYLVWIKINPTNPFCMGIGDCEAVNTSPYSTIRGVPVALFGALTYAALIILFLTETRSALFHDWAPLVEFGLALVGTLYSAYLTYLEVAVIHKICPYCVTSAISITVICILCGLRLPRLWQ